MEVATTNRHEKRGGVVQKSGREAAFQILEKVEQGGYAQDLLLGLGDSVDGREAGLASAIVFGVLRHQGQIDFVLERFARRPVRELDAPVRVALRAAVFQLRYLERIPPHAAVNQSVEWVKRRAKQAAGFANAVLRKVGSGEVQWPSREVALSCPEWLLSSWSQQFGDEMAEGIAAAALKQPFQYVRMPAGCEAGESELVGTPVAGCYRLMSGPAPDGARLQDIGSQAIIPLLELQPGMRFLDLCAAPGNKTLQALETELGLAVACDVSLKRLRTVPLVCARVNLDATKPLPFGVQFERIFIDAPCSGTGTLARNPEIKWRLKASDIEGFRDRQRLILRRAFELLAPGGRLVYATCSLEKQENDDVVAEFRDRLVQQLWRIPGRDEGDGFYAAAFE